MFIRVKKICIESKSKWELKRSDMHVVITVELSTIVSCITIFELELVPIFFHMDSIIKFKNILQNWSFATIVVIIVDVRVRGNSKSEK
jgi:hypothetical protein